MITRETIKILADAYQTTEQNIFREYFQHLFLSYFYRQPKAFNIYFKGGTALRILYRSPRFSEDLDFSAAIRDTKTIEQLIVAALAEIEREGVATNIHEAKTTSGGYLARIKFQESGQSIFIQLEISFRKGKMNSEITTIASDFIPPYTIAHLAQDELVDEKIQALLSRQKPRDFYDLYFILRSNLLLVKKRVVLPEVLKILSKSRMRFDVELKLFLPKNHQMIIKDFKAAFEREIKRS